MGAVLLVLVLVLGGGAVVVVVVVLSSIEVVEGRAKVVGGGTLSCCGCLVAPLTRWEEGEEGVVVVGMCPLTR